MKKNQEKKLFLFFIFYQVKNFFLYMYAINIEYIIFLFVDGNGSYQTTSFLCKIR